MKGLTILLILTSCLGYLEWGADNRAFLVQMECAVLGCGNGCGEEIIVK